MADLEQLPVVVIVGRPNVGKSTLFNALVGQKRSIVGDEPGITRDRIHSDTTYRGKPFEIVDTGGIIPNDDELIPSEILRQARHALDQAAQIVFLIDGRTEITSADRDLSKMLHKLGKPVTLVVNKIDTPKSDNLAHEFHSLGFPNLFPVSAEHRTGIGDLLDHITSGFPRASEEEAEKKAPAIRVAIIGRPNVGKSTLLNAFAGEERSIVSPVAGTTRDAVDETIFRDETEFVFVDTAGIRRKGKTHLMAEKLSVVMARKHIRMSHVAVLMVDATEGVVASDATIAGYAHEEGRALILCVNKWDMREEKDRAAFIESVRDQFKFLEYAQVAFVSAKTGMGVPRLFGMIRKAYESASMRVTTGQLNRFIEMLHFDTDLKVKYITQASIRPPTFVVFADRALHFSTERFLINQLRKKFGFEGTPIVIKARRR
jgi:GTP-binding protein